MRNLLIIIFALQFGNVNAQLKKFSSINDKPNYDLVQFLEQSNFGKVTLYFNEKTKQEREWSYYPELKISKDLTAVCVSTLPEIKDKYTFIIIVDTKSKNIKDTIGPFYDSFVDAVRFKLRNQKINFVKIRTINPPELFESKYTIFEYKRKGQSLTETIKYDKN